MNREMQSRIRPSGAVNLGRSNTLDTHSPQLLPARRPPFFFQTPQNQVKTKKDRLALRLEFETTSVSAAHCLTNISLSPLRAWMFLRRCSCLFPKTATSLLCSGAGEGHGIRERERGRYFMRQVCISLSPQRWRHIHKDPFAGEWEQIISWLVANPQRSPRRPLPGVAAPLPRTLSALPHPHTRARHAEKTSPLLEIVEEQWQAEVICGPAPPPVSSAANPARSRLPASPSKPLGRCLVRQCTQESGERVTLIEDHTVALHIRHEERVPL